MFYMKKGSLWKTKHVHKRYGKVMQNMLIIFINNADIDIWLVSIVAIKFCYACMYMASCSVVLLFQVQYIQNCCFPSLVYCITEGIMWLHHGKDDSVLCKCIVSVSVAISRPTNIGKSCHEGHRYDMYWYISTPLVCSTIQSYQ